MKTAKTLPILLLVVCLTLLQESKSVSSKVAKRGCGGEADPEEETEKREGSIKHAKDEPEEEGIEWDSGWEDDNDHKSSRRSGNSGDRKKRSKKEKSRHLKKRENHCNIGGVQIPIGESKQFNKCNEVKCEPGPEALYSYIC